MKAFIILDNYLIIIPSPFPRVRFSQKLPEQYKLMRQKLFRIPQWTSSSDAESDADADDRDNHKAVRDEEGDPHPPMPTALFNSHANPNNANSTRSAAQSRSRSLSISLEQEAGMRRTESKPRRVLQREVSMSKAFKGRRHNDGTNTLLAPASVRFEASDAASNSTTQAQVKGPIVLVEGTPQKPKAKSKSAHARTHGHHPA